VSLRRARLPAPTKGPGPRSHNQTALRSARRVQTNIANPRTSLREKGALANHLRILCLFRDLECCFGAVTRVGLPQRDTRGLAAEFVLIVPESESLGPSGNVTLLGFQAGARYARGKHSHAAFDGIAMLVSF